MERQKKLIQYEELVHYFQSHFSDGISVCIGGLLRQNRPVALIRALIQSQIKDIRLYSSPASGYDVDLMIAAGIVKEAFLAGVTLESHLCPAFRGAVERGELIAHGVDALTIAGGLMASAEGIPFHPVAAWKASDVLKYNPLIKKMRSPFDGEELYAVKAIRPDVALIHAQEADVYGNIRNLSTLTYADNLIARASKTVIVSVDKIVPNELVVQNPRQTTIPCHYVDVVVEIPYGAHPTGSYPFYATDDEYIEMYYQIAESSRVTQNDEIIKKYLEEQVFSRRSNEAYLDGIGGIQKLLKLEKEARFL